MLYIFISIQVLHSPLGSYDLFVSTTYPFLQATEKTGKRYLLAVDVSSSMALSGVNGTRNIAAREAAATIALMIAKREQGGRTMGFTSELKEIPITANMKLEDATKKMGEVCLICVIFCKLGFKLYLD